VYFALFAGVSRSRHLIEANIDTHIADWNASLPVY